MFEMWLWEMWLWEMWLCIILLNSATDANSYRDPEKSGKEGVQFFSTNKIKIDNTRTTN